LRRKIDEEKKLGNIIGAQRGRAKEEQEEKAR
jgi:hypothetical protein